MTTVENDTAAEIRHVSSQAAIPKKMKASLDRDISGEFLALRRFDDGSQPARRNVSDKQALSHR
jgi:hypothetical protein